MITEQGGRPEPIAGVSSRTIAAECAEVREARIFVTKWCERREFSPDVVDDVCTITSELVTNAITHACGGGLLRLYLSDAGPVVEVWDDDPTPPVLRSPDLDGEQGRGLAIIAALSASWGSGPLASGGKCVWAVIGSD